MPHAVELFLDEESAAVVTGLWRELAAAGIGGFQISNRTRPHVSLGVYDRLEPEAAEPLLSATAATTAPLPVTFASLGCFLGERAVLYLAPVVSAELLALHAAYHARAAAQAAHLWSHYRVGQWVPHCTLTLDLAPASLPAAVAVAQRAPLPLAARLVALGLVEYRPAHPLLEVPLGAGRLPTP